MKIRTHWYIFGFAKRTCRIHYFPRFKPVDALVYELGNRAFYALMHEELEDGGLS
jgi:hypothetical protein